jgi:hypothetical protein
VDAAKRKQLEANVAAAILLEFRDGRATDMQTLFRAFDFAWPPQSIAFGGDDFPLSCASLNLAVQRDDDFFTANTVVEDVWKAIVNARLIVADCTDRNPNVFYEIGLAHAIGKPTILLTQRAEDIPFDLRHLRYIAYQLTPRGMREFETKFKETIQNVLSAE